MSGPVFDRNNELFGTRNVPHVFPETLRLEQRHPSSDALTSAIVQGLLKAQHGLAPA
jgi:hypothetical protein